MIDWDRPGAAPYDPFTGEWDLYGGMADASYKRLNTTVDLTGKTSATLDFMSSFDLEPDWDYLFVEARPVGTEDWTTLQITDDDGIVLTDHTQDDPGRSCADDGSHWSEELHPQLVHYMTVTGEDTCDPVGTTGSWNALTGNSGGWQHFNVDLADYLAGQVELNIVYAQDWGTSGLGVFLDDVRLTADGAELSSTSFEDGTGVWTIPGPPEGTQINIVDWERAQIAFDEASGIRTADSIWLTFGLEGLASEGDRTDAVRRALTHFGVLNPGGQTPEGGGAGQGQGGDTRHPTADRGQEGARRPRQAAGEALQQVHLREGLVPADRRQHVPRPAAGDHRRQRGDGALVLGGGQPLADGPPAADQPRLPPPGAQAQHAGDDGGHQPRRRRRAAA